MEVSNRQINVILEKTVSRSRKDWASKLDDAFWVYRTAYKTPLRTSPYKLVYRKSCHLPVELEHKALWDLKELNMDLNAAGAKRFMDLQELEELRLKTYENAAIYKEKTKKWHDNKLVPKTYQVGDKVLLFNSRLRLFPGKMNSHWSGPFVVHQIYSHGAVELIDEGRVIFRVNGQPLKKYYDGNVPNKDILAAWYLDPPV